MATFGNFFAATPSYANMPFQHCMYNCRLTIAKGEDEARRVSVAKEQLDAGLEINFDSKIKSGFKIGPADGSYQISFTDSDFENYFVNYLKDRTKKLIFS